MNRWSVSRYSSDNSHLHFDTTIGRRWTPSLLLSLWFSPAGLCSDYSSPHNPLQVQARYWGIEPEPDIFTICFPFTPFCDPLPSDGSAWPLHSCPDGCTVYIHSPLRSVQVLLPSLWTHRSLSVPDYTSCRIRKISPPWLPVPQISPAFFFINSDHVCFSRYLTITHFAMHRIHTNRINSWGMSRVFCDLRSRKTPRKIVSVNSNNYVTV